MKPPSMTTHEDAAFAGALVALELFDSSPGAPKYELLNKLITIILYAIESSHVPQTFEPSAN